MNIDIVIIGRNDSYRDDWNSSLFKCIDYNLNLCSAYGIKAKIIFVEWNAVDNEELLSKSLVKRYADNIKCIIVNKHIHYMICKNSMSVMVNYGYNCGARHAESDWILLTGGDCFISEQLIKQITTNGLIKDTVYRARRVDIHKKAVNIKDFNPSNIMPTDIVRYNDFTEPLLMNASGDFVLMHKEMLHASTGYDESFVKQRIHLDSQFILNLHHIGAKFECLGDIFHIDHSKSWANADSNRHDIGEVTNPCSKIPYRNATTWGLANYQSIMLDGVEYLLPPGADGESFSHGERYKKTIPSVNQLDKACLPLVSLVTICRNARKHIQTCIDSLIAQEYPNIEIIVQDGASTDGTVEILADYGGRISLVSEPDSGHSQAMFRALKRCKGQIIGTCNADDMLLPDAVSWAVAHFIESPEVGAIYGDYYEMEENGTLKAGPCCGPKQFDFEKVLCVEDVLPMQSSFFRRRALEQAGLLQSEWFNTHCEDYYIWLNLGITSRIEHRTGAISCYRVHGGSSTFQADFLSKIYYSKREILERFILRADLPFEPKILRSRALLGLGLSMAEMEFVYFGRIHSGMEYIRLARAEQPDNRYLDAASDRVHSLLTHINSFSPIDALYKSGGYSAVLMQLDILAPVDYWMPTLNVARANTLCKLGKFSDAVVLLKEELKIHPNNGEASGLLNTLLSEGKATALNREYVNDYFKPVVWGHFKWSTSRPLIDVILRGAPEQFFSWCQREGWAHALIDTGRLNNLYWAWDNDAIIQFLFKNIKHSKADFILAVSGDQHLSFLNDTQEKKDFWKSLGIPVVCHCAERIVGGPFTDSETNTRSALESFAAFVYIDELSESLFDEYDKPAFWVPQYVDEKLFNSRVTFENRKNEVFFRGQLDTFGFKGAYERRHRIIKHLRNDRNFTLSEAYRPLLTPAQAAELKSNYRFVLNAPANCTGYSSSLYEALGCGCAVFQYQLPPGEIKSNALFTPNKHFILYDADEPEKLAKLAEYSCRHWQDYASIAQAGMEECLAKHTIKIRLNEITSFVEDNWKQITNNTYGTKALSNCSIKNAMEIGYSDIASRIDIVAGEAFTAEAKFLFEQVKQLADNSIIVAIGDSVGMSIIVMGYACVGTGKKIHYINRYGSCIDKNFNILKANIDKHSLNDYVELINTTGSNNDFSGMINNRSIDLAVINGSYGSDKKIADICSIYSILNKHAKIAIYDSVKEGEFEIWTMFAQYAFKKITSFADIIIGEKK